MKRMTTPITSSNFMIRIPCCEINHDSVVGQKKEKEKKREEKRKKHFLVFFFQFIYVNM